MKGTRIILAAVLALVLVSAPLAIGTDSDKADLNSSKKSARLTEAKRQSDPGKPEQPDRKEQPEAQTPAISPIGVSRQQDKSAGAISPIEAQPVKEQLSAAAVKDKGRQIKWQILCTGGACGNDNVRFGFVIQDFHILCGSVGQTAVGPGSSPSFGVNSGYWQEFLSGYLRGDCNRDGAVGPGDIVYLINYLFRAGPAPDPLWVGDCNCDEAVGPGDVVFLLNYLFRSGPSPVC